ncbi:unnamed protein product [Effrenium voratum]|uniref:RING-type domain-containing protein n=1 Tax=Effrenium voratum TaxID=2562239 RepID=A0AA36JNA8_9DINO|nr:unnamed protein product [Effrenium voratum]
MEMEAELLNPDAISDTLKCPVCFEVFADPVFCGGRPCQHVFCRCCVEQCLVAESDPDDRSERSGHCPTCRAEICVRDLHPHQALRSLLDELPVRCRRGCGWTGRRDALRAHESPGPSQCVFLRLEAAQAKIAYLSEAGHHLENRDARIAQLEVRVAEQDQQVVDFGRQLLAREVRIAELERHLEKQERELTQKDVELALLRARGIRAEDEKASPELWL